MELLKPLRDELEENYRLVTSTEELIKGERDMLQGESDKRVVLLTPHNDVWRSIVLSGSVSDFEEASDLVSKAYRRLSELSMVIEKFNSYGPSVMYSPILKKTSESYGRKNLVDLIHLMCSEAKTPVYKAKTAVEKIMDTECPVCEQRFESRTGLKSHMTQKTDPEHQAMRDKVL